MKVSNSLTHGRLSCFVLILALGLPRFLELESPEIDSFANFWTYDSGIDSFLKETLSVIPLLMSEKAYVSRDIVPNLKLLHIVLIKILIVLAAMHT